VSNCDTPGRRERYVKRMEATGRFSAEVYGGCGMFKCPRGPDDYKCFEMAASKYRLSLSVLHILVKEQLLL
jgi:hypothetical protein